MSKIVLQWKPYKIGDKQYYYTYTEGKFFCVAGDKVKETEAGLEIPDTEFIFQVKALRDMGEKTRLAQLTRMLHMFPVLTLDEVKKALNS